MCKIFPTEKKNECPGVCKYLLNICYNQDSVSTGVRKNITNAKNKLISIKPITNQLVTAPEIYEHLIHYRTAAMDQ